MSDYLKNLQESNAIIHGFIRKTGTAKKTDVQPLMEDDKADDKSDEGSDEEEHECEEGYKWCPKKKACVSMEDMDMKEDKK
jgi:hypothetical protein